MSIYDRSKKERIALAKRLIKYHKAAIEQLQKYLSLQMPPISEEKLVHPWDGGMLETTKSATE